MAKRIELKDLSKELGNFAPLLLDEQKKAVLRGIARSIPDLVAASPVDTGMYAASWGFNETEIGAILGNYAPYAGVIEYGARPHKMPIGPLLAWAKRVTMSGSQPPDYDRDVWALAIYTQKKIAERGQAPLHIMQDAIPMILENIRQELQAALNGS